MRHCEEPTGPAFGRPVDKLRDEAIQSCCVASGLLRGACHRAAFCANPLVRNDDSTKTHHALSAGTASTQKPSRFSQGGRLKPAARSSEPVDADYFFIAS
jgi:hypothetical protein